MLRRRLGAAVAFIVAVVALTIAAVSPLQLGCTPRCQMRNPTDYVEGGCPVKMSSVPSQGSTWFYAEDVTVHVWMKADDILKAPKVEILTESTEVTIRPMLKRKKTLTKPNQTLPCNNKKKEGETRVWCDSGVEPLVQHSKHSTLSVWELLHDVHAETRTVVSVSYNSASMNCSVRYTVRDPTPDFDLSVNQLSKSITVTVEPGKIVHTRCCYQKYTGLCEGEANRETIYPSQSESAVLYSPYLLPCLCVEAYYTYLDARREKKCPFRNQTLIDVRDVWLSSKVELYESHLEWYSVCPASDFKISASLCWRQHEHLCTPVPNSTLEGKYSTDNLIYNTYALDRHPQMCVQFSLHGSHNISCPFSADMSSWEVYIEPGRRGLFLYVTSFTRAEFSAQLCVSNERGCTPRGDVHTLKMDGNMTKSTMNVPLQFLAEKPCVQVWQSDPSLRGRRIFCPDYTHGRYGMYAVAALIPVLIAALLGLFIHRLTKRGAAGWLRIEKPVLLVCSSEQSAHVSAVCALASILQGELSATVNMAMWALSSQREAATGVADLGPLPWLYGQWEAVRKAQGRMLIVWSPEAKKTYEIWREERANADNNERKKEDPSKAVVEHEERRGEVQEDFKKNGRSLGKGQKEKAGVKKHGINSCADNICYQQKEPSTVIAPVFSAALACLEGALHESKGRGVALVYFQGLCHSSDIPKVFKGVPRYCLPQDFRGLIQELGETRKRSKTGKFSQHCWSRLVSKVLLVRLARQLAQRLETLLPQTQAKNMPRPGVTSSPKMMSDKSGLKLPLTANVVRPGTAQEHKPLRGSPW